MVGEQLGFEEAINAGLSGSSIGLFPDAPVPSFLERLDSLPAAMDLVTVLGGSNDYFRGIPLGSPEEASPYTFYGAYT